MVCFKANFPLQDNKVSSYLITWYDPVTTGYLPLEVPDLVL